MIESSFSFPSSWVYEPLQDITDTPFVGFDCIEELDRDCSEFSGISRLNESSNSFSDYDSLSLADLDKVFPIADSFISEILEESNSIGFQDKWPLLEESESRALPVESSTTPVRESPKKREKSLDYLSNTLWSKMTPAEQLETLHSLSKIVTCKMGLREQIKVIKIIDPSAVISPNDTEFALDVSSLNDEKMKRIQDLVRKHKLRMSNSSKKLKSSSKNISSSKHSESCKISSRTNSKAKRRQKKQKTYTDTDEDEDTRLKRKLELHGQKEMRSGLFVYEKVIKLSNPLEDEDVNILE